MIDSPRTILDGTPEEIIRLVQTLPPNRYHVEVSPISPAEEDFPQEAMHRSTCRTQEQIDLDRAGILAQSSTPKTLPEGKTILDVTTGTWPGEETDEVIQEALKRLS